MGTHAVYGFKKNNTYKVAYSNFDGNYEWIGKSIVDFIQTTSIKELNNIFDKIIMVDVLDKPTEKEIKNYRKYANLQICTRTLEDYTCLLAKTIGRLDYYKDKSLKHMINGNGFLYQESYQYIINLDSKQLEIWWYEMLVNSYDLCNISENWINECNKNVDMCYRKWKKESLNKK